MNFKYLQGTKNLLAFSAGSDSSALFFLLIDNNIDFDIAHVNYNTRSSSDDEARYAQALAQKYHKTCYAHSVTLEGKNFEAEARKVRYDFFEGIMLKHHYEILLTAHHLNDRLEWFLMQLSKGAGVVELMGMQEHEVRENYTLVRPLLQTPKATLQHYLQDRDISWYEDESNSDTSYKRNYFRHQFSNEFIEKYEKGVIDTFTFLSEDVNEIIDDTAIMHQNKLSYFTLPSNRRSTIYYVDKVLKQRGYLMSQHDRAYLQVHNSAELSRRFLVAITERHVIIVEGKEHVVMDKKFKELCRSKKVPTLLRGYFFKHQEEMELFF